jgi:hypothetical protein
LRRGRHVAIDQLLRFVDLFERGKLHVKRIPASARCACRPARGFTMSRLTV